MCAWAPPANAASASAQAGGAAACRASPAALTSSASMRRSCRPSARLQPPRFLDRVGLAARLRRLRRARSRSSGSRCCSTLPRASASARPARASTSSANIACSRPWNTLRLGPLVGQRDALAHLGGVGRGAVGAFARRAGDRQAQQHGVGARLVASASPAPRPAGAARSGSRHRRSPHRCRGRAQDAAIGGVGGRAPAFALLQLGERGQEPAPRRRRQARRGKQRLEAAAGRADSPRSAAFSARQPSA